MEEVAAASIDLAGRILEGDTRAEAQLYSRFAPGVRQLLLRRLNDFARADELTQDVLIVVLQRLRTEALQDAARLPAFVAQTARNLAFAELRKERRRRTDNNIESLDAVPDEVQDHASAAELASSAAAVHTLLAELKSSRDRLLLERYYLQDEDKEIICRDLDINEATFNVVLFRARARLLELIEKRGMGKRELLACLVV